ncbi:endopeptidase La [Caproiciproducens sp. CPB-2]|uniref:endopeptidase La n=1 Tax=Caproiciproducens sp. CPB-2 TaxID=3030017 RepID=UPI0023DA7AC3|nr:endopeptidase La [Caproiciproducens sp. CPB-2]MDF1495979.1 endopeptidase La [Caproiciproducens sp. CPB-2]
MLIIPIEDLVLLPGMVYPLAFSRLSEEELSVLQNKDQKIAALPLKRRVDRKELETEDFYKIGIALQVLDIMSGEKGHLVKVKAMSRVEVSDLVIREDVITGNTVDIPEVIDLNENSQKEMASYIQNIAHQIGANFKNSGGVMKAIDEIRDLNVLIGYICQFLPFSRQEKYTLMETSSLKDRGLTFIDYFLHYKEEIQLQIEMTERFSEKANKNYREAVLREQLQAIQEELNEGKPESAKKGKDYRTRIENAHMPEEIRQTALEELSKLESQNPASADYNVLQNYLDLLVELPWETKEEKPVDIREARRILDEQHYGLEKVKDRIIQQLAVLHLKKDKQGSILLLVGPPGTGKTSLGRSIAEALGRKYVRLSLGGIRDEAEIRGHRRTYIGAMPGRIIQSMKKAGTMNPVMVLDEVDKLMTGYNGDPASALLEVLDPEQNDTFTDHYLDLPYNLSNVFFIATANSLETIPGPLLDRMEVIQLSSYTSSEKFHIGKNHLIREALEEHGLTEDDVQISDEALRKIIADYTMEAGVRGLKKRLDSIARKAAEKIVLGDVERPYTVSADDLEEILGSKMSRHDVAQEMNPPGVVTGLAWTPVGGEILFIEATEMPGNDQIILTGQLGDVMKESARISLSLLKSRLPVNAIKFKEKDIHIHVPSGAVPKDGPSAGITLFTALASLITGIKVDSRLAMTGEITLRGTVLPIGGLKEKLLAAERAGIRKALIPKDNVADLKDIPDEVKEKIRIVAVETIEDVLREALGIALPKPEYVMPDPRFFTRLKEQRSEIH